MSYEPPFPNLTRVRNYPYTNKNDPFPDHHHHPRSTWKNETTCVLTCDECHLVLRETPLCGAPTKSGKPCRSSTRPDLGFERCWPHSEKGSTMPRNPKNGRPVKRTPMEMT